MTKISTLIIEHLVATIKFKKFDEGAFDLERIAYSLTNKLSLNVVKEVSHKFEPIGETLVFILSESHIAFHTWPEFNILHVDLVSGKGLEHKEFKNSLEEALNESGLGEFEIEAKKV